MNNLYIIGNGFDIAHKLDTQYWNFRTFLEEKYWEFLLRLESLYDIHPLDPSEYGYSQEAQEHWNKKVGKILWSEFERFLATPDIHSMLDVSESVVGNISLESSNCGILDTMDAYWHEEYGFIRELQQYVKEWIEQIDLRGVTPRKNALVKNNSDYFFSFNYTRILEDVYRTEQVLHIHGSVGADAAYDPIMGHCNSQEIENRCHLSCEAYETFDEAEASIQKAVANYLREIYKDANHYINLNRDFFARLQSTNHVVIIGWSAGESDLPYLQVIKNAVQTDAHWTVYYYDQTAYNSLCNAMTESGISAKKIDYYQSDDFWDM